MAGFELVGVPARLQDSHLVAVEGGEARLAGGGHGHPLGRDGMTILQSGGAHLGGRDVESFGELADEVFRAHAALLHPEIEEITLAGRLVGGDLRHLEVLGLRLDAPADAGQVGGDEWGRVERHDRAGLRCGVVPGSSYSASAGGAEDVRGPASGCKGKGFTGRWTVPQRTEEDGNTVLKGLEQVNERGVNE